MAIDKNFVVKNGLEVSTDLILANANTNQVGIATTNPRYTLHVNGGIGATDAYVTGIATFKTNLVVGGTLTANASAGSTGQYLKSTATGVEWASFPNIRTSTFFTATVGQTSFSFAYTVGLLDVFVNGVKLANTEYVATDGISVVLNNPCFGGEVIEIIGYGTTGIGAGGTGIAGITVQEEGVTTGSVAAVNSINFVGAAVTAVGTGAGVTVYITGGSGGGGGESYWTQTAAGIHTLGNVGIATTNPRFALEVGAVGASGTSLWVNGNARVTGILTIGTSSIVLNGSSNTINVGSGVTIEGNTGILRATEFYADGVRVGVITADTIIYEGSVLENLWVSNTTGIHTTSNVGVGTTNASSPLTVSGDISVVNGGSVRVSQGSSILFNGTNSSPYASYTSSGLEIVNLNANPTYIVSGGNNSVHIQEAVGSNPSPNRVASFSYLNGVNFFKGVNITGVVTASQFIGAASSVTVLANNSSATTHYVGFFTNTTGSNNILSDNTLQYVPSTNTLTAGTFDGNISANNITSGTLDNARLPANVNLSGTLNVSGVSTFGVNLDIKGFGDDSIIEHTKASNGDLYLLSKRGLFIRTADGEASGYFRANGAVELYYDNSKKFETLGTGVTITGTTFTNQLSVSGVSTIGGPLNGVYFTNIGGGNIAIGQDSLLNHTFGFDSIGIGYRALYNASNSNFSNIAVGYQAGYNVTNGVLNSFFGYNSGRSITGGSGNVILGSFDGNSFGLDIRNADNYIVLSANGQTGSNDTAPKLVIDPNGNTGIGTTNPGEKLQVDGNIRVGISTTSNYIAFRGTTFDGPGNTGGELRYQHTYIGERIYDYSGNGERSELLLFKGNDISGADGPDRIRLLSGEHRFDVIGFNTTGTFEQVGVSTAAVNKLTITSTGVGIGTTNPTSALTVKGNTSLETLNVSGVSTFAGIITSTKTGDNGATFNSTAGQAYITLNSDTNFTSFLDFKENGTLKGNIAYSPTGSGALEINSASNRNVVIATGGGNVGINTTNPTNALTVTGSAIISGVTSSTSFYGDASYVVDGKWTLGANGTSDYTFVGIGFTQTTNDPVLYLARGRVYEFVNNSGGSHPFQIRVSNGGSAYNDGVTNNGAATGTIRFEIPMNAPNTLYYQCTNHAGMGNTISVYPSLI